MAGGKEISYTITVTGEPEVVTEFVNKINLGKPSVDAISDNAAAGDEGVLIDMIFKHILRNSPMYSHFRPFGFGDYECK